MTSNDSSSFTERDNQALDSRTSSMIDYGKRRRIDIAKRFKTLQTRKERLIKELDSLESALLTLRNHMQED